MRPFRFGVSAWSAASRAEWADKARRFEDLGFSTLLIPDHLVEAFLPLLPLVTAAEATTGSAPMPATATTSSSSRGPKPSPRSSPA